MSLNRVPGEPTPEPIGWSGLGRRRHLAAVALGLILLPAATIALHPGRPIASLQTILLTYLLIAVLVAFVGGALPGVGAAIVGFLAANWFFTSPYRTWSVDDPENLLGLLAFLVVASSVGLLVAAATNRAAEAQRARSQVEALARSVSSFNLQDGFDPLVSNIREVFGADTVALCEQIGAEWVISAVTGDAAIDPDSADEIVAVDEHRLLALDGLKLGADDRSVLAAFAVQASNALEREQLRQEAARVEAMSETDRLRTALLRAVSHDLRTPLASIKASVTSLIETGIAWSPDQTRAFLETIRLETERLDRLVGQLLDAGRIQVGAVQVNRRLVAPDEIVTSTLSNLSTSTNRILVDVPDSLPLMYTDPMLLERVLANLTENAVNHSPPPDPVTIRCQETTEDITIEIIDHGPGIPPAALEQVFQPFQRLSDDRTSAGVGLGLAVTKGFLEALELPLAVMETPGGGTTITISVPTASRVPS